MEIKKKKRRHLRLAILILVMLVGVSACSTSYITTTTNLGNRGQVVLKTKSAEGSYKTSVEINEDYSWADVTLTINITVEVGSYRATFTDDDGKTVTLDASAGNPAQVETQMTTDAFGSISLNAEASGAQGVVISIDYTSP